MAYDSLTPRQRECLRLVARDRDSKEIGRLLGKSPETVNAHIKSAMARLNSNSRFAVARELREFETAHPSLVNPPPVIGECIASEDPSPVDYMSGALPTYLLRDGFPVAPRMERPDPARWVDGDEGATSDALRRLMLVAAITVLMALSIVAAVPMSETFQRFADLLAPHLRN